MRASMTQEQSPAFVARRGFVQYVGCGAGVRETAVRDLVGVFQTGRGAAALLWCYPANEDLRRECPPRFEDRGVVDGTQSLS